MKNTPTNRKQLTKIWQRYCLMIKFLLPFTVFSHIGIKHPGFLTMVNDITNSCNTVIFSLTEGLAGHYTIGNNRRPFIKPFKIKYLNKSMSIAPKEFE